MKQKEKKFTLRNHIEVDCAIKDANKKQQNLINLKRAINCGMDTPLQDYYGEVD